MSDYAHNTMTLFRLHHKLQELIADYHAESACNAQEQADKCLVEIQRIREQINNFN